MPKVTANGLEIEYDTHGDPANPPMLLVMGLGAQMTLWPIEFVQALADRGFHVIRYDNRDIGLSQKFEGAKVPGVMWHVIRKRFGFPPRVPYTLSDMAADGMGVLDALGIDRAHVVGASMGGMIAQLMAVEHGHRLLSLTSVFSTTGNAKLPQADKAAIEPLTNPPTSLDEEVLIEHGIKISNAIGSPSFRPDPERQRERVRESVRRSVYPAGLHRQVAAIIDDGDRTERLKSITAPTLVLHGEADPLVKVEGGHATAAAIPGAKIKTYPGWGHDLPEELVHPLADDIAEHAKSVMAEV
ncbi:alpha/beta fold hydrolase [Altererythrobacter sp.]|uniref:alpha/beta fold hydrolase n=1 Tax=Altererythrobacter sp. TaxID=1872480 RepID=UPI001B09B30C|nr:alpha/beta fold hydrolase [Altererythrobacter sp.]MBO6608948.1 alpha/beta fold hydrolase [Altererythrobacter sp.]MBO6642487.1 alpha/beta fold hydrolase [Altererythrobacter sp.]MBO6709005.1 alpha/beta fold hydrolase [Altererythrobacter sp.]MBO6944887.1 alpha/beta fold hydrolase [Altererythrobacter sp.]